MFSHVIYIWNWYENSIFQKIKVCHKSFASVCHQLLYLYLHNYPLSACYVTYSCQCQYIMNAIFKSKVIFGQIITGPMDLFYLEVIEWDLGHWWTPYVLWLLQKAIWNLSPFLKKGSSKHQIKLVKSVILLLDMSIAQFLFIWCDLVRGRKTVVNLVFSKNCLWVIIREIE